jgi:hypothetical protein
MRPLNFAEELEHKLKYRFGAEAESVHILESEPDPFPPHVRTGNWLSDCRRYAKVTAAISWYLFRRTLGGIAHGEATSYKIEIIDEYSHGEWFSDSLRFATEAEAVECSQHFGGAGWNGLIDLRVVDCNDPVNARGQRRALPTKTASSLCLLQNRPRRKFGPKRNYYEPGGKHFWNNWTPL